jgi:hypothetical protein
LLACSLKAISPCSTLGEAAPAAAKVENMEEIIVSAELEHTFGENPVGSDDERYAVSPNTEDDLDDGASYNAKLRTYYFRSSTITVGKIKEMKEKGYFPEGEARALGAETVPEPNGDEAVMYEDFLLLVCACLHIWPWQIFYCTSRRSCIS